MKIIKVESNVYPKTEIEEHLEIAKVMIGRVRQVPYDVVDGSIAPSERFWTDGF